MKILLPSRCIAVTMMLSSAMAQSGLGVGMMGEEETGFSNFDVDTMAIDGMKILQECGLDSLLDTVQTAAALAMGDGDEAGNEDMDILGTAMSFYSKMQEIAKSTCSGTQKTKFSSALDSFHTCSGIDLLELIEDLPSALVGTELECILGFFQNNDLMSLATSASTPKLSDECASDLFGANPLGDLFRNMYLFPDRTLPCFKQLEADLPGCVYEAWPIPIIGQWLQTASCILGSSKSLVEDACDAELKSLDGCLPPDISKARCDSIVGECSLESLTMSFPKPLLGGPLPDTCSRIAESRGMSGAVSRYDSFRSICVSEWEGWSIENGSRANPSPKKALQKERDPANGGGVYAQQQPQDSSGGNAGGYMGTFVGGTIFGMLAVALIAYRREKQQRREFSRVASQEIEIMGA